MSMSVKRKQHLFTILAVLVVSAGGFLTWRASATTSINPGYDQFNTPDDGQSTEAWTLPTGFFTNSNGSPSNQISGLSMSFKGGNPVPNFGADTVVQREDSVTPGAGGGGDTTRILLSLSLVGSGPPVQVTFADGTSASYLVAVRESQIAASEGSMQFNANSTFNILDWPINREYTFTSTDASQPPKIADSTTERDPATGNLVFASMNFGGGNGTWSGSGRVVHIQPHLHGPPQHNHFVLPTPSPSPTPTHSPSPVPTVTIKPIPG
jgi:hypothetical protein